MCLRHHPSLLSLGLGRNPIGAGQPPLRRGGRPARPPSIPLSLWPSLLIRSPTPAPVRRVLCGEFLPAADAEPLPHSPRPTRLPGPTAQRNHPHSAPRSRAQLPLTVLCVSCAAAAGQCGWLCSAALSPAQPQPAHSQPGSHTQRHTQHTRARRRSSNRLHSAAAVLLRLPA